jgi:putative endonuclease
MYHVYILRCGDNSLYTGITTDVKRRIEQHKKGVGGSYTRAKKAIRLEYSEKVGQRGAALRREAAIKRLSREMKLQLISRKRG